MEATTHHVYWHEQQPVYTLTYDLSGTRLITGGGDKVLRVWEPPSSLDPETPISVWSTLQKHAQAVNVARFNSTGTLLATGSDDGKIFLWRLAEAGAPREFGQDDDSKEQWQVCGVIRDASKEVNDLCWLPDDGYIVAGTQNNTTVVYRITHDGNRYLGECVATTPEKDHSHFVQGVAWDPLNCYIATASADKLVNIYQWHQQLHKLELVKKHNSFNGKQMFYSEDIYTFFRRLTWSPDGAYLVTTAGKAEGDDNRPAVYIFARNEWKLPVFMLEGFGQPVVACKFSPIRQQGGGNLTTVDYSYLVAIATLSLVTIYSTCDWQPIAAATNLNVMSICDVAWHPNGKSIMVLNADGMCSTIKVGELSGCRV